MTQVDYDDLPQAIKSQYKRKRVKSVQRRADGRLIVLTERDSYLWTEYYQGGWKKERHRV